MDEPLYGCDLNLKINVCMLVNLFFAIPLIRYHGHAVVSDEIIIIIYLDQRWNSMIARANKLLMVQVHLDLYSSCHFFGYGCCLCLVMVVIYFQKADGILCVLMSSILAPLPLSFLPPPEITTALF